MKKLSIVFVSLLVMACGSVSADPLKHSFTYYSSYGPNGDCSDGVFLEDDAVYVTNLAAMVLGAQESLTVATSRQLADNRVKVNMTSPLVVVLDVYQEHYGVLEECMDKSKLFTKTGIRTYTLVDYIIMEPLDVEYTELTSYVDDTQVGKGLSFPGETGVSCIATGVAGFCN